jgi:hypothetical protein
MTPIISPTTNERIIRTLGITAMFAVFSGLFLYDGYVGYPNKNIAKAVESLDPVPSELPAINPAVTYQSTESFVGEDFAEAKSRQDLEDVFGAPGWVNSDATESYYFGPGGVLRLELDGDLVRLVEYVPGEKDDVDLSIQKWLGFVLAPFALLMLLQIVRVLMTRVELSDDGLKLRGRKVVGFDAMRSLDATQFRKKGFVDLSYDDNGSSKTVRLDDYVVREFRPIVEEICRRCGFDSPIEETVEGKAEEAVGGKTAD